MDNYFLEEFDTLWKRECRCFELKLECYDKDTFEDDKFTFTCELARRAKTKILEFHYEALKNLYGNDECSVNNFKHLEDSLNEALTCIDMYVRLAKEN